MGFGRPRAIASHGSHGLPLANVNVACRDADVDRAVWLAAERPCGAGADHACARDRERPAVDRDVTHTDTRIQIGVRLGWQPQIDIARAHADIHRGAGGQRAFQCDIAGGGAQARAVGEGRVADADVAGGGVTRVDAGDVVAPMLPAAAVTATFAPAGTVISRSTVRWPGVPSNTLVVKSAVTLMVVPLCVVATATSSRVCRWAASFTSPRTTLVTWTVTCPASPDRRVMLPAVSRTTTCGVPVTTKFRVDSTVYRGPLTDPTHAPISEPSSAASKPSSTKTLRTPPISHQTQALPRRRGAWGGKLRGGGAEP